MSDGESTHATPRLRAVYDDLVRDCFAPVLDARGLTRHGRTWSETRPGGGLVTVALRSDEHGASDPTHFWVEASCWPPGTWDFHQEFFGADQDLPAADDLAPLRWDSRATPDPALGEGTPDHRGWRLSPFTDLTATTEAALRALDRLLETARECADVDVALDALLAPDCARSWCLTYAIVILRAGAPGDDRRTELVERHTNSWSADPRPITLRPHLEAWRSEVGLPDAPDLPRFWTPAMMPHLVERHGTAQAAYLHSGCRGEFCHADGTVTDGPPPGWLEGARPGSPQDKVRRRWWWRREG